MVMQNAAIPKIKINTDTIPDIDSNPKIIAAIQILNHYL